MHTKIVIVTLKEPSGLRQAIKQHEVIQFRKLTVSNVKKKKKIYSMACEKKKYDSKCKVNLYRIMI